MFIKLVLLSICLSNLKTIASQAVVPCPGTAATVCKNSGFCVILFGAQLSCTCPVGFTGK